MLQNDTLMLQILMQLENIKGRFYKVLLFEHFYFCIASHCFSGCVLEYCLHFNTKKRKKVF